MSEPIKKGDLVVVVRTDCPQSAEVILGAIREVEGLGYLSATRAPRCEGCGQTYSISELADIGRDQFAPLAWLRRIPPLSELEGADTREEIPA